MSRDLRVQLVATVFLIASLLFSGAMAARISSSVGAHRLTAMDSAEEGDPPQVGLGIAMGAFRGLFVNMLWMRANDLKEEGKYYEAMELARAITRLQPRFSQVWVFHAWNMAYNISVTTQTPQERWQWVNAGIRLLRNEGVVYNPNDMLIHKELAWIFLHKIGGYTDDANGMYKRELAAEWTEVLGAPPAPTPEILRSRDAAIEAYAAWLQEIADAPDSLADAIAAEPGIQSLIDRMNDAGARPERRRVLAFYAWYIATSASGNQDLYFTGMSERERAVYTIAADPELVGAWKVFLAHLRKRTLIDDYNMEPDRMIRYTRKYGPIDWRHPAAHALYWAARGVEQGIDRVTQTNVKDFDFVNTDRMVIQAVQELYRSGELYFGYVDHKRGTYALWDAIPNLHFFESYGAILAELVARSPFDGGASGQMGARAAGFYQAGYENFLKDGVRFYYRRGQRQQAEAVLRLYRTWPYRQLNMTTDQRAAEERMTLDEWIQTQYADQRWSSPYVAQSEIGSSLQGAFAALLVGDREMFNAQFQYAAMFHAKYFETQGIRDTAAAQQYWRVAQVEPDFRLLVGSAFARFMNMIEFEYAERVYDLAPNDLQQFAYDYLQNRYRQTIDRIAAGNSGRTFDQIFPEPREMESFRQWYVNLMNERAQQGFEAEQR